MTACMRALVLSVFYNKFTTLVHLTHSQGKNIHSRDRVVPLPEQAFLKIHSLS